MNPLENVLRRALNALTVESENFGPQGVNAEPGVEKEVGYSWVKGSEVVGLGIGEKVTLGKSLPDLCLRIYVKRKLPRDRIDTTELIPERVSVPDVGSDLVTDVIETGELREQQMLTTRARPVTPGYSVGNLQINTGTIGCLVRPAGNPGTLLILSNSHILANYGLAAIGDDVIQPGINDGGGGTDIIGTLLSFVPFDFSSGYPNLCDAAVAQIAPGVAVEKAIAMIGLPQGVLTDLTRGMQVQKTGRTTGHTVGIVTDIDFRFAVRYPNPAVPGNARQRVGFRDQVACTRYTDEGDSGAVVCDMQNRLVGLHFVGGDSISVFSPILFVFSALGVQLAQ